MNRYQLVHWVPFPVLRPGCRPRWYRGWLLFADMAHALVEHGVDMIVGKRVEDVAAVAAELDQVRLLKRAQLVRYCRLRGCGRLGDVSHAELASHEGIENLDARGVAEDLEQIGQVVQQLLVGKVLGRAGGGDHGLGGLDVSLCFTSVVAHCNILSYEHALI